MTILRFPLDRARPSKCGRIVCCEGAEVVVLLVVRVERAANDYLFGIPVEMTTTMADWPAPGIPQ